MPLDISAENQAALEGGFIQARDFLSIWAKNRISGAIVFDGSWSDVGTGVFEVIDPDTGAPVERTFFGSGTLVGISAIPRVANLTVQRPTVSMSQVSDRVNELLRTYDVKQARVQIHRGLFDPGTRQLVAPAFCRFAGFVDGVNIPTPAEGGEDVVTLTLASHTQELTRNNPETRSHESQQKRHPGDDFLKTAATEHERVHYWGRDADTAADGPKGLFGWGNFLGFL